LLKSQQAKTKDQEMKIDTFKKKYGFTLNAGTIIKRKTKPMSSFDRKPSETNDMDLDGMRASGVKNASGWTRKGDKVFDKDGEELATVTKSEMAKAKQLVPKVKASKQWAEAVRRHKETGFSGGYTPAVRKVIGKGELDGMIWLVSQLALGRKVPVVNAKWNSGKLEDVLDSILTTANGINIHPALHNKIKATSKDIKRFLSAKKFTDVQENVMELLDHINDLSGDREHFRGEIADLKRINKALLQHIEQTW
jgi:hypothetical protein